MNTDGALSKELGVPATFPIGAALIMVKGSTFDQCDDTGSSQTCVGYAEEFTVT